MALNSKQVPVVSGGAGSASGLADITIPPRLVLNSAHIAENRVSFGFSRIPGLYPFKAFALMNEAVDPSITVVVLPDSNDTVCAVRISNFVQVAEVGSKLGVQVYWKTGNNPQGILAEPDIIRGPVDAG